MGKSKKGFWAAALLGLATLFGAAPLEAAPSAPAAVASAVRENDGRTGVRYSAPKDVHRRRKSRVPGHTEHWLGKPGPSNRNRFARRSVTKAALAGRGRAAEMRGDRVFFRRLPDGTERRTTRRQAEKEARLASFARMLRGRATAARVLEARP